MVTLWWADLSQDPRPREKKGDAIHLSNILDQEGSVALL